MNMKHNPKFLHCISLFNSKLNFEDNRSIWYISSFSENEISQYH